MIMTQQVNGVKSVDVADLNLDFDFNHDGKIDVSDYEIGSALLNGNEKDYDGRELNFTQSNLDNAFE